MDEQDRKLLTSRLQDCVSSDPRLGALWWKRRPTYYFDGAVNRWQAANSWNSRNAGVRAFETVVGGIKKGRFFDKWLCAHIVVWTLDCGRYPEADEEIIHINGDKLDNRLDNLQCMSRTDNLSQWRDIPSSVECVTRAGKERYRARYYAHGLRFVTGLHDDWPDAVRQADERRAEQEEVMSIHRAVVMFGHGSRKYRPWTFDGKVLKERYDTPQEAGDVVFNKTDPWS